jgi:serine/threonine protein kinase
MSLRYGKWQTELLLGEGHFTTVYRARRPVVGSNNKYQFGALKVLHPHADEQMKTTIANELNKLPELNHPRLSRLIDSGQESDGTRWFVMSLIEGESLEAYINRIGTLTETEWLKLCDQLLESLDYLRSKSILHLDIKPDNIMRASSGDFVLVDFGLASKVFGENVGIHNNYFSAPEQFTGDSSLESPSTDLFSAAISIYIAKTGRHPWSTSEGPLVNKFRERIPASLDHLEEKYRLWLEPALSLSPESRPAAKTLRDELVAICSPTFIPPKYSANPKTWRELEGKLIENIESKINFVFSISAGSQGDWVIEGLMNEDASSILFLEQGNPNAKSIHPHRRKLLSNFGWRNDTKLASRLLLELGVVDEYTIAKNICRTLSLGLGISIENMKLK